MAVPDYSTDLAVFNDASNATGWGEFTGMALGGGADTDTDLAIHGSICITQDRAKVGLNSQGYDGNAVTINAGEAFFIWTKFFAPNSLDTLANGGQRVVVGTSLSVWDAWSMDDDLSYAYGGWKNYAVDPTFPSDFNNGTVTTYNACGNGWNLTAAPQKGNPFNTDIIRYGRGESIFIDGDSGTPATFYGYSEFNDDPAAGRFGLIQAIAGGYLYKGLMTLGTGASSVYMEDANVVLNIDDTTKVDSAFNRIEVNNASSTVEWTAVLITALGTVSKGQFEAVDNATINKTSCTFTDMDSFIYQSNSTLLTTTHRRCGLITQGGSTMTSGSIDSPTGSIGITVDNLSLISKYEFISDDTGHAINMGTISADVSYNWGNTSTDYTASSSGDETILVSVDNGYTLTLDVTSDAGNSPSVYNTGLGTVVINDGVTFKFTNVVSGSNIYAYNETDSEEMIAPTTITTDPWQTTVPANKDYWFKLAKGSSPFYKTILESGNTSSGVDRRIEQNSD